VRYLYKSESISIPQRLLFIPLKETVIFPYVIAPLFFQSDEALAILNKVLLENSLIGCVSLRDPYLKDPQPKDLLSIGTVCKILQMVSCLTEDEDLGGRAFKSFSSERYPGSPLFQGGCQ